MWRAALVCAAPGCDHLDCPFNVVFAYNDLLSEDLCGSVLVGNAVCFIFASGNRILEYHLGRKKPALISLPFVREGIALMTAEDGGLGFAYLQEFNLHLWSREPALSMIITFAAGADMIFIASDSSEIFAINLKLGRVTNIGRVNYILGVFPYVNFYTPGVHSRRLCFVIGFLADGASIKCRVRSSIAGSSSYMDSSPYRASKGGSWGLDTLKKVSSSAPKKIGVVRLAVVGVPLPLLVPILLGGPFVLQGFLPLLEGGG
ncbi:hypothetical protein PR202_gb12077 [Eleusine coracana subsp. coracana]|uniref:Uncharacterized protein n=1 Tax=Eleusine coracana subsp. coracana TaxID=191504 RepID=A0AAV5EQ18_ELECO|nr:hypothetical protein PR202_gb12077 [Eleusine coracana subsp. coracana]